MICSPSKAATSEVRDGRIPMDIRMPDMAEAPLSPDSGLSSQSRKSQAAARSASSAPALTTVSHE